MIQREWREIDVITYSDGRDEYGQTRRVVVSTRKARAVKKQYDAQNVANPDFLKITTLFLTDDLAITENNAIVMEGIEYFIKYTVPSGKYLQLFAYEH